MEREWRVFERGELYCGNLETASKNFPQRFSLNISVIVMPSDELIGGHVSDHVERFCSL